MSFEFEITQKNADDNRVLEIALKQHDPEMLDIAHTRISQRLGKRVADSVVFATITKLMNFGWSFFDTDDNPSPLLNHNLPD